MRGIATGIIDGIHKVIKDLRPSLLDDLGIDSAIMWLVNKHLSEKGISCYCDFKTSLTKKMSPEVEISVFRILQEAIVNVARHSKAENVFITTDVDRSSLLITIEDDGSRV